MIVKAVLESIDGDTAVLSLAGGQKINWPKEVLPNKAVPGAGIRLALSLEEDSESADKELARDILNEIFDTKGD